MIRLPAVTGAPGTAPSSPPPESDSVASAPVTGVAVCVPTLTARASEQGARAALESSVAQYERRLWPAVVLRHVFRYLTFGELAACGQVCRNWRQVADEPTLQLHCAQQTWAGEHRQQMAHALVLEPQLSRLADWCTAVPSARALPAATGDVAPLSPARIFCAVVCSLLQAPSLRLSHSIKIPLPGDRERVQELLCSPDGQRIALLCTTADRRRTAVGLLRYESDNLLGSFSSPYSKTAGRLTLTQDNWPRVIYTTGHVRAMEPESDSNWSSHEKPTPLIPGIVYKTALSQDGRSLAVVVRNSVLVYGESRHVPWEWVLQGGKRWEADPERFSLAAPEELALGFSPDSCHLAFAFGQDLFILQRQGNSWDGPRYALEHRVRGQPLFDPGSRWLALASGPDSDTGGAVAVSIGFWQFYEPRSQWAAEKRPDGTLQQLIACVHPRVGYRVVQTFSPDGQLLAVPAEDNCRDLRVFPVTGANALSASARLVCGRATAEGRARDFVALAQFSSSSQYLAVLTDRRVIVWRRGTQGWHQVMRSYGNDGFCADHFSFSPDGYHCALVLGSGDAIAVYGPLAGGPYAEKMVYELAEEERAEKVLFMPDATRLLVVTVFNPDLADDDSLPGDLSGRNKLRYLALAPDSAVWPQATVLSGRVLAREHELSCQHETP